VFLVLQKRDSSDNPILNAFCRVAPSVRLSLFAIFVAVVFLRASAFRVRTSVVVQARLLDFLFTRPSLQVLRGERALKGTRMVAYVYFEDEPGRRAAANLMTKDEARRIASNIAKLPDLLGVKT